MKKFLTSFLLFCLAATGLRAEWRTETYTLKAGWNAIYPTLDASYLTLDQLLVNNLSVQEIWRWQPERTDARLPGDINAAPTGSEWSPWKRGFPEESTFNRLDSNYGYLVKVEDGTPPQTLTVKGRAALPEVRWRGDGIHLAGFPVVTSGTKPTLSTYLAPTGFALVNAEILRYDGGNIAAGVNPVVVVPSVHRIERGQAYWIRVNRFARYYGPLKVEIDAGTRVDFGTRSDEIKLLLTNQTPGPLSVTLSPQASESAPAGQPAVAGAVPLKIKVDGETEYTPLTNRDITLPAGAIMPVRLVVDRVALSGPVGTHFASLIRLHTTAGISGQEVFLPVTADVGSVAGLWIGEAEITHVGSIVRRYERDAAGNPVYSADGSPRLIENLTTPQNGGVLPAVKKPYPLRLILHVNASRQATVLSHVFQGKLAAAPPTDPIGITTLESLLNPADLKDAVRLSVAHLPLDTDQALSGIFDSGGTLTSGALITGYNQADNPFLHIYHPDHDNRDARFQNLVPAGAESFDIKRSITLTVDAIAPAGAPTSWGTTTITGAYSEIIEGPYKTPIRVEGAFGLYKVSDIPVLTRP